MKKRDLMNFIDHVENKAVKSVEEKFLKLIQNEKKTVLASAGYTERIAKIQKKINDLHVEASILTIDMGEDKTVNYQESYSLAYRLNQFAGKKTFYDMVCDKSSYNGGSVELIKNKREKEINEVKENYSKVRVVSDSYTSAAKISEYLKALGFDLSVLEQQENQALTVKIDKTKLFVCGDNK